MTPTVLPVADMIYRTFYDEQEYRQRMQQLAGFKTAPDAAGYESPAGSRISSLSGRLRAAASAAITATLSL